jgi:anti-sigma regulatory factor (Ser/Thr protein kinase)
MLRSRAIWVHPLRVSLSSDPEGRATIASEPRTPAPDEASAPQSPSVKGAGRYRRDGGPVVGENLTLRLPGGPEAAARARGELSRLRSDLDPPLTENLRLLVTELISNAVKHAGARTMSLKVLVARKVVFAEVTDTGPGFEPPRAATPHANHFGLFLVERLADRWGVVRDGRATKVWFELRRA